MNQSNRDYFDLQVEWVMDRLPQSVLDTMQEIPLHVEDQPSERLMQQLGIADAEELCGYFSGVPYVEGTAYFGDNVYLSAELPVQNSVTIFRRGIVAESRNDQGKISRIQLRRQIRITILHELAHLHGMNDDEIANIGYG